MRHAAFMQYLLLVAMMTAIFLPTCTPTQAQAVKDVARAVDTACVLLVDTGAPGEVKEVCAYEETLYPYVDKAVDLGTRADAVSAACPASPEVAPVVAVRKVGTVLQPGVILRDRSVLRRLAESRARVEAVDAGVE